MNLKKYPTEYLKFVELFNRGDFFEAHEVLELKWREDQSDTRDFYQGLIQIAAVFVHILKGTPDGGRRLLQTATNYFEKYLPEYEGLDLHRLIQETEGCLSGNRQFPQIILGY